MATRTENTVTINQPAEKVHKAFTTQEYWAYIAEHLSPEPGEVNEFNQADGGAAVTLFEVLPLEVLPEAVRAMISQALKVKRVINVSALADGAASIDYNADVKGTPVDFKGTIGLAGDDVSTTLVYNNEVSVNIPFMGPAIEPKVADA
ncbi:MAG: DUF2505 domain-containing protein, partial [Corynebacterium sp.]|nr:DUF2505 domain-containing protein [Corynebacterium sp.]